MVGHAVDRSTRIAKLRHMAIRVRVVVGEAEAHVAGRRGLRGALLAQVARVGGRSTCGSRVMWVAGRTGRLVRRRGGWATTTRTTIFRPSPALYSRALGEKFPVWAPSIRPAKSAHYFPPSESEGGRLVGRFGREARPMPAPDEQKSQVCEY